MKTENKNNQDKKSKKKPLNKLSKEKKIKFDFNPVEVKVSKYNLIFPVDGMF